jgi:galactokinase
LIGEHTDYNGGFVLPTPIPRRCRVELAPRNDRLARVGSANVQGAESILEYTVGAEVPGRGWLDYVQGVTHVLNQAGYSVQGFDLWIQSSVPLGSGLASSAALEVSLLRALRSSFALELDDLRLALIGKRVENDFVGARTGVMDQMAASLAREGTALFIDTRSLDYRHVPLPDGAELVVLGSGVSHQHARGNYNTRRAECERACELLGVAQLRDVTSADLPALTALPEPLGRRARHVVTENDRVLAAVEALQAADLERLGALFYASHESQRDLYEVSIPEIDLMVDLARAHPDVYGARLTGGGFGGSVVLLARAGTGHDVAHRVAQDYAHQSGRTPTVLVSAAQ